MTVIESSFNYTIVQQTQKKKKKKGSNSPRAHGSLKLGFELILIKAKLSLCYGQQARSLSLLLLVTSVAATTAFIH